MISGLCFLTFVLLIFKGETSRTILNGYPFRDPDDIMRMVQVVDWVQGASWYDVTQSRLNPPYGVMMHWSRLPDIPLAAVYMLAKHFVPQEQAIILTSTLMPPLLGVLFFLTFLWAVRPLAQSNKYLPVAGLTCLILLNGVTGNSFLPGRIDHHNWQILLSLLTLGGILRIHQKYNKRAITAAAIASALGLWVGAEALVSLGLACIALTLIWVRAGNFVASSISMFGFTLAASTLLLFSLAIPPERWTLATCDSFSATSVALAVTVAIFFYLLKVFSFRKEHSTANQRFLVSTLIGCILISVLALMFPGCKDGPYAGIPKEWVTLLTQIDEARNISILLKQFPEKAAFNLSLPTIALVIALRMLSADQKPQIFEKWLVLTVYISGGILVTLWQIRGGRTANAYAGLVLAGLAVKYAAQFFNGTPSYKKLLQCLFPIILTGLLPICAASGIVLARNDETSASAPDRKDRHCDWVAAAKSLAHQNLYNSPPRLIATLGRQAPIFLLLTSDNVLGTYYHRDREGIIDTMSLFNGDVENAKSIIRRRGVNLLFLCKKGMTTQFADSEFTFKEQLSINQVPDWLEKTYSEGDLIGFTVKHP